jgi:hypothetical protein
MKKLILARYGGLSPIKQNHYTSNYDDMSFHGAPEKYGIYAFLWPYIDWFLLSGTNKLKSYENEFKNKREQLNCTYKKFSVNGPIWVHLVTTKFSSEKRTESINYTLKSAFKFISTDHLEIFVPKGTKII